MACALQYPPHPGFVSNTTVSETRLTSASHYKAKSRTRDFSVQTCEVHALALLVTCESSPGPDSVAQPLLNHPSSHLVFEHHCGLNTEKTRRRRARALAVGPREETRSRHRKSIWRPGNTPTESREESTCKKG